MNDSLFDQFPVLTTERLVLREPRLTDVAPFFEIYSDPRTVAYAGRAPMEKIEEAQLKVEQLLVAFEKKEGVRWILEEKATGKYVGSGGFWRLIKTHYRAEIGYELHPDFWNRGYMTEALETIIRFGFEKMGLHSVEANIHPDNTASMLVLKKLGFEQEGYFKDHYFFDGEFSDTASFSLLSPLPFQA